MVARITVATTLLVASTLYVVSAQDTRSVDPHAAAIAALVSELRAVRQDLADASQRSLRFQLLLARLQLQEQRISHLDRQRVEVAQSLIDAQSTMAMFGAQLQQMQRGCEESIPPEERKACEAQVETLKATVGTHQARELQLRTQEQELTQAIGTEQGRWADLSARLDELERTLVVPR